jgi:hypothetical protein
MRVRLIWSLLVTLLAIGSTGANAHAQGSFFTSLSGTVVDSQGAVIPGADVKVKNNGTGIENTVVTGSDGGFTIPSLSGGVYRRDARLRQRPPRRDDRGRFEKAIDLRVGPTVKGVAQIYILPQDIIDNTVKAFAVSATSPTGYGALGAPTGRYLAPANGPACIETAPGYGDCGVGSLVVNGPPLVRFDVSAVKRVRIRGRVTFEFRGELQNALNKPYFNAQCSEFRVES